MSTVNVPDGVQNEVPAPGRPRAGRWWAYVGILAGVAGIVGIQASMSIDAVYAKASAGDPVAIMNGLAGQRTGILVMHVSIMTAALLILVFAAGLSQRLRAALPAESILPSVAAFGLVLTSAACLLGTGLTTELVFGLGDNEQLVPEFAVVGGHWMGTIPWLWAGAGVSAVAVAVALLRGQAGPRWIGWVSLVLGLVTAVIGVSPLQYLAGFTGPLWVLVSAIGFGFADTVRD
ncbi:MULTISPECIES: hypothetical protein [Rhodococcus]|uniref:hypothetical protein n=1 Tax=Rhodococcus TaxID=1827 RepID=UPI001ED915CB|nr:MULTISPECIES: hypothetical protein [Rhodococcus]